MPAQTSEWDLFKERILATRVRACWVKVHHKSNDWCPSKNNKGRQRKKWVQQLQSKEPRGFQPSSDVCQGESRKKTSKPQKRAPPLCNLDGKAGLSNKRAGGNSKVSNSQKRPPLLETRGYRKKADALVPEALSTGRSQNHSGKCCFYWNTTQEDSCLSLSADLQPPKRGPCWAIPEEAIWWAGLEM